MENTVKFANIQDLMCRLGLKPSVHPMIAIINYDEAEMDLSAADNWFVLDFYKITLKNDFRGSVRYGAGTYDFQKGGMAFLAPGQAVQMTADVNDFEGYALYFDPRLLEGRPLAQGILEYGFFDYATAEALLLSENEKTTMNSLFEAMSEELATTNIDTFTEDVVVAQLELLLRHSNRFYNRQFQQRKSLHHDLISRLHDYLNARLTAEETALDGLPSPQDIAAALHVSQRYLSDMLKALTGKTTQQHIHLALVEKAKLLLGQTTLSTAEIAFRLGFEHPQSFNKLFRQRTGESPAKFRRDRLAVIKGGHRWS